MCLYKHLGTKSINAGILTYEPVRFKDKKLRELMSCIRPYLYILSTGCLFIERFACHIAEWQNECKHHLKCHEIATCLFACHVS